MELAATRISEITGTRSAACAPHMDLPPPSIDVLPSTAPAPPLVVGQPEPPSPKQKPPEENGPDSSSWLALIGDAVAYPVRKGGMFILMPGMVLGVLLVMGTFAPVLGYGAMLAMGYFSAFYINVVMSTINGANRVPDWPDVSSIMDDLVYPALQMTAASVVAGLPLIIYQLAGNELAGSGLAYLGCLAFAACYLPMAVLSTCFHGDYRTVLPDYVLPAIMRSLPGYLLPAGLLFLLSVMDGLISWVADGIPLIGSLGAMIAGPYLSIVHGRMVGLIYRRYQERIGW